MDHVTDMMQDVPWAPRHHLARPEAPRTQPAVGFRGPAAEPAALRAALVPPSSPALKFEFKRDYGPFYTNQGQKFVLREEHAAELKRLVLEHKRGRESGSEPLTMSDIVNAALDLALEHPSAFHARVDPARLRESLGREVMRKAFIHFLRQDPLSY